MTKHDIIFVSVVINCIFLQQINTLTRKSTIEFIEEINNAQSDWVAEENEFSEKDISELKQLMGFRKSPAEELKSLYNHNIAIPDNIPQEFDSREKWHTCASISSIKDQSNCGSCWAVSSASAMSDRLCISTKHKIHVNLSAEALMTCCESCTGGDPGCEGGYLSEAWKYYKTHGLVTGGDYGSNEGCQPYGIPPCDSCSYEAETPHCRKRSCTNKHYKKKYKKDLHKGKNYYKIPENVTLIQADILSHGPLVTGFEVYADFMHYKSGVYSHVRGGFIGLHAVRILGWGLEKKKPYWLVANSWNRTWGSNGLFKIRRGVNECTFEENVFAGLPKHK